MVASPPETAADQHARRSDGGRRGIEVCYLIRHFPPEFSGHGLLYEGLLPHLEECGIDPTVVALELPDATSEDTSHPAVERLLPRGSGPVARVRRIARLRSHLRSRRYDVIHSCTARWEFLLNLPWLKRRGTRTLYEMALLGSNDPMAVSGWRWGRQRLRRLQRLDLWIGVSSVFREVVRQAGPPAGGFRVVHGAVDVDRFRPASPTERAAVRSRLGLPTEARIAITVGSVIHRKGIDRVLDAWAAMGPRRGRDLLLVVGPRSVEDRLGPDDLPYAEAIGQRAESAELAGTVRLTGRVDQPERYLRSSDLSIFLSRREGMGLAIVEAMACGLAGLVSPLDGIAEELIEDRGDGLIARDPDDAEAVGRSIRSLLDDATARREMGRLARRTAVERFSMRSRAKTLERLYRELVGGAR